VSPLLAQPVFQSYAAACALLVVGLHALGLATGRVRASRQTVINAEDVRVYRGSHLADAEHPQVARAKRVHHNLIESALPFFGIGLLYTLTDPNIVLARVLFFGFVGLRLVHAVVYMKGLQPARLLSFFGGMLVNLVMVAQVLRAILT
jgi:glutathione S-transferase